jgi:small-conductance mechanosensitive channel
MALLRRIAGGVVFVVALITFLLCATGTVGAWIAKATVDETTLAMIDIFTDYIDLTIQTIETIDRNVADVEQTLNSLQRALPALRTDRADGPVAQRTQQVVTAELQPALEQLTSRAQRLRDGLERLNQGIEQLNRLPFLEMPTLTGALSTLDEQIAAARTQGQMMLTAIERRDSVLLQSASERMDQRLGQARTILAEGSARAGATQATLIDIRQALTFWSTVSTTAVSALLAIFAAGQVSLAVHAWGWMRGRRTADR